MRTGNLAKRQLAIELHCNAIAHEQVIKRALQLSDKKLEEKAKEAQTACTRVRQHYRNKF